MELIKNSERSHIGSGLRASPSKTSADPLYFVSGVHQSLGAD